MVKNKREKNGARLPAQEKETSDRPGVMSDSFRFPGWMAGHPLAHLRGEMDALFERYFSHWPAPYEPEWGRENLWGMEVDDTGKEIVVWVEAPGFEPTDFDIHLSGNMLTVRAERKREAEEEHGEYRSWERHYGRFRRSVSLPAAVVDDKVEARYHSGVLEIRLPRKEEAPRQRIDVKS